MTAPGVTYLDHAASTPLRPEALAAMLAELEGSFGNPSGGHAVARRARQVVEESRDAVAGVLGCRPAEVVFTSGGTEADNLAIAGNGGPRAGLPVCSAIEHHAVLHAVEAAGGRVVGVTSDGALDLDELASVLAATDDVSVVSVLAAGNETGRLQDLDAVADVVAAERPGTPLHTDAVQAAPWLDLAVVAARADLVAVAAHKLGGPKGTGCLVVREGTVVRPLLHGGGQERERRSGTHDVAGIAGSAAALVATAAERAELVSRVSALRDRLLDRLVVDVPGVRETTPDRSTLLPGHAHVLVDGCESEALLFLLDEAGVCAAAGSSCASGATEPSHVLLAMGIPKHEAATALRLTLGRTSTGADVDVTVAAITAAAARAAGVGVVRVLVAMSGGVDSSVAAALLLEEGHHVVGATMKLWGGPSDTGCCSVADVDDARRVGQQLGIAHHVFSFTEDFDEHVVAPYVAAHAEGRTPNPCVECNRHLKLDRFLRRALSLGFDAIATGHHARVVQAGDGFQLRRGADPAKDQSYVLHMADQHVLERLLLPVGELTKAEVRARAAGVGLRTADKPDSQDVCFISRSGGRAAFLGDRVDLHPAPVVDGAGHQVGTVDAVELVTIGQRRGLGLPGGGPPVFAVAVDVPGRRVEVGPPARLLVDRTSIEAMTWVDTPLPAGTRVLVQSSAHGTPTPATWDGDGVVWTEPQRRVAAGQSVALYAPDDPDRCLGGGLAA